MRKLFCLTRAIICVCSLILPKLIFAQKLPAKQTKSVRSPNDIKIDGRATEWNDKFKAYNSATDLFYTMSNNDQYLYLVMQAKDPDVINKIFSGGITLTIQGSGKKTEKDGISITYPIASQKGGILFNLISRKGSVPDASAKAADSVMRHNNNTIQSQCKFIKVGGIKGVDTLISVYNQDGISSAGLFDDKKIYTLEMGIPLKYLELSTTEMFSYHIRLNGKTLAVSDHVIVQNPDHTPATGMAAVSIMAAFSKAENSMFAPTDFWGEYTLAKK